MPINDEFHANLEALPNILRRKYALLRDMDKSLQEIQRQNELRCEQEIDDMKRDIRSGNVLPDSSLFKLSSEALDEQKHAIRIADEKVALAMQAYDLVDTHIQQLDQFLKKFDEEQRQERDTTGAVRLSSVPNKNIKDGRSAETGSNRGRKKTRLATTTTSTAAAAATTAVAAAVATPSISTTPMELDLPVDPNEPTYCFCNQVSYGEMVACDNPDCKIEWFHYGCVGLKEPPKGKWYCTECVGTKRRRKSRQN